MPTSVIRFSPTQNTLEEIARSALPLMQALGLNLGEDAAQKVVEAPTLDSKGATARVSFALDGWNPPIIW
ncbi:MAG: hypothetical protein ACRDHL_01740 [Candidatus Promineifilaceae bacterium]